jgi:hypothetical protein
MLALEGVHVEPASAAQRSNLSGFRAPVPPETAAGERSLIAGLTETFSA